MKYENTTYRESRKSPLTYPVGELIREELEARSWTLVDLVCESGLSSGQLRAVMSGPVINQSIANGLARAFGTSSDFWINLAGVRLHAGAPAEAEGQE